MEKKTFSKGIFAAIAAVVVLAIVSILPKKSAPVVQPATTHMNTDATSMMSSYKDGTYTATGNYDSPAGNETIGVTVTLKDGVIVSSDVVGQARDEKSIRYQGKFISGYKALVIGKKIDEVQLDFVSGSSLTPAGFNDALSQIKAQAQS